MSDRLIGVGLTEAESLSLSGYFVEPLGRSDVSGGTVIRAPASGPGGTASGTFTGEAGSYWIDVVWLNENDGASNFSLKVDGVVVDSWTGTGGSGGTGTPTTRRIAVELDGSDTITLSGQTGGKEYARIDSLTVTANTPIDPIVDAFDFFAFAGQSNAEGHFFLRSGDTPGPLGFEVFEDEILRLTGVDTTAIEAALGGSGSNERADSQKYWWDLGDNKPGPALLQAVTTIRAGMLPDRDLDGIVWAQGEDDMTRIRSRGHDPDEVVADLKTATTKVFEYFRSQFGDVPIFIQELGEFEDLSAMALLREAQRDLIDTLDYVFLGAQTAGLDQHDQIHFSNAAYGDIAERLAQSAFDLIGDEFIFV